MTRKYVPYIEIYNYLLEKDRYFARVKFQKGPSFGPQFISN